MLSSASFSACSTAVCQQGAAASFCSSLHAPLFLFLFVMFINVNVSKRPQRTREVVDPTFTPGSARISTIGRGTRSKRPGWCFRVKNAFTSNFDYFRTNRKKKIFIQVQMFKLFSLLMIYFIVYSIK